MNVTKNLQDSLRRFKAETFQALAHPTRIAIVELLREGEVSAGTLFERVHVEQANLSQHLAVLRTKQVVVNRKEGNQVFYSIRDPLLIQVLDVMRDYFMKHLSDNLAILDEMRREDALAAPAEPKPRPGPPSALGLMALAWLEGAGLCAIVTLIAAFAARPDGISRVWNTLLGTALLLAGVAGTQAPAGPPTDFVLPLSFGSTGAACHFDPLAAWFLLVMALAGLPICLYLPGYMKALQGRADMRLFSACLTVLLASMAIVVMAANALTFLVAWELMSLSSFALVGTNHAQSQTRQAALIYLGATRVSAAFLVGAFLWATTLSESAAFSHWHVGSLGPALLLLVGLGIKAGSWPFHLWLPVAHPTAPAPISAIMSGLMVKVPLLCLIRFLILEDAFTHPWLGYTLVVLGAVSTFWGVAFALIQQDLKRLLAYSTVENVGLVLLGIGGSLVARDHGLPVLASLSLAAALLHVLNHAVFKSLLFLGAGAVDEAAGTLDLEHLGGLGRRMPRTFACFVLGSAAIAAFPPLNGFASEWLLYQVPFQLACGSSSPTVRFLSLLTMGWLALAGAMAVTCFLKACGVAFLGHPRSPESALAHEVAWPMQVAQMMLAALCVWLGLCVPALLQALSAVTGPLGAVWTVPLPAVALVMGLTVAAGLAWMRPRPDAPVRSYWTWDCGFGPLSSRMQVTGASFIQPTARLFGTLFRYAIHLRIDGANRRLFPESITVEPHTEAVLESRVYAPIVAWIDRLGQRVVQLQAGSIHTYLLTMLATLLVLLILGAQPW